MNRKHAEQRIAGSAVRRVRHVTASLILVGGSIFPLFSMAQGTTATLGGTVTDPTGAVVPKAQIVLKNEATGDQRTSVSNGSGVFSFSGVPTGNYEVTITAPGFRSFEQTGIHLDPGDQRTVRDINLAAGAVNETVEVSERGEHRSTGFRRTELADLRGRDRASFGRRS